MKCSVCKNHFPDGEMYEYRGAYACEKDFDEAVRRRDGERAEIIEEQHHATDRFKGLDMGSGLLGQANRQILKTDIELANKESERLKKYEGRA